MRNVWWFIIPLFGAPLFVVVRHKEVAKRMADMAGYDFREKAVTVFASIMPYPFMVRTIWVPFSENMVQNVIGIIMYLIGIGLYLWTLFVFAKTPLQLPLERGPYRISRNPMYSSASIAMTGVCTVSGDHILIGILLVMILFQHFMILAEERICKLRYSDRYKNYIAKVPRYIFF